MKNLIIISAPSGAGKTTLCKKLQRIFIEIKWSVSYTTRSKRDNEVDGEDYNFISKRSFNKLIKNKSFAEWENVHGNLYGTKKKILDKMINENKILLLDLDVKGALNVKNLYPENSFLIFIVPPSFSDLKKRLKKRNTESDSKINLRLKRFKEELKYKSKFDYILINKELSIAFEELTKIVKKIKQKEKK